MQISKRDALSSIAAAAALLLLTPTLRAADGVYSRVLFGQGDGTYVDTQPKKESTVYGETVEAANTIVHQTPNGPMTFNATGTATTTYQSLKAGTSSSLSNTYYDPNYTFEDGVQSGVPTNFDTYSQSQFYETLQYGGSAHDYTSTYRLRLTGSIERDDFADTDSEGYYRGAQVTIRLKHGENPTEVWSFREEGNYAFDLFSQTFVHGASPQTFFLEVITNTAYRTQTLPDGSTVAGAANFGNTLQVVGVDLRDNVTGEFLANGSITNQVGESVPIVMVPEPGAAAIAASALVLARRRRRR